MEADTPVIAVDGSDTVTDQSRKATELAALWEAGNSDLKSLVKKVRLSGVPAEARIQGNGGVRLWVVAVVEAGVVLVLAHDTTMPDQMLEALIESRSLLKSLLDSAADFSFEVDGRERFRFVSPKDAFGQDAEKWAGQYAGDIFWPNGNPPARNPFACYKAQVLESVPVDIAGQKKSLQFSVSPVLDSKGNFMGVRGSCRDVTETVIAARQTRQDNLRLTVQQKIMHILNATENAQELLDRASQELVDFLRADLVWFVMQYNDRLMPAAICGEGEYIPDVDSIWKHLSDAGAGVHEIEAEDRTHIALRLDQGLNSVGMVIISRDTGVSPWSGLEIQLLEAVGDILAVAFGKAQLIERLYRLSGKDELTDILNRRALAEVVERRLSHHARMGSSGCLLFIDLDNFKEVNDTLGHSAGDEAIRLVAKRLEEIIRSSDVAGRFGGDEFVVWLEGADADIAQRKATLILEAMPAIREKLGKADLQLAASIGICQSMPGVDLKFTDLTKRADEALYEVKKAGKNNIAFAPLPNSISGD